MRLTPARPVVALLAASLLAGGLGVAPVADAAAKGKPEKRTQINATQVQMKGKARAVQSPKKGWGHSRQQPLQDSSGRDPML